MTGFPPATPQTTRRPPWQTAGIVIIAFVAALWVIEIVNSASGGDLTDDGIRPRQLGGLWGVLWAPLLHANFTHLESNTIPLLVLGFLVLLGGLVRFGVVTATVWLVSGIGVWIVGGSNTVVVGASGIAFGWLAYIIVRGVFTRSFLQLALGVVILVIYGSLLWGVLPGQPGVSWQGHLFGALGGVLAARAGTEAHRMRPSQLTAS
jgi:membrane associated rhomboid family serine protease